MQQETVGRPMGFIRRSLKNTLVLSYVGITLMVLIMVGGIFYGFIDRYADQKESEVVQTSAQQAASELIKFIGREPVLRELRLFLESVESLQNITIDFVSSEGTSLFEMYDSDERVLLNDPRLFLSSMAQMMGSSDSLGLEPRGRMGQGGMMNSSRYEAEALPEPKIQPRSAQSVFPLDSASTELLIDGNEIKGFIIIDNESDIRSSIIRPALGAFGIASAIALVIAGLLGWLMGRKLSYPLSVLSSSVSGMSEGNLEVRVGAKEVQRGDEIGLLARQFNLMAEKLELTVGDLKTERDTLKNFLSDASHELRTPLTALIAYLELLQGQGGNDETRRVSYLERSQEQAGRIKLIIARLLELSRMEGRGSAGKNLLHAARCKVGELIEGAVLALPEAEAVVTRKTDPSSKFDEQIIYCDQQIINGVLQNVIGNSIKFSRINHPDPADIAVLVETAVADGSAVITITDNGPGIPAEDMPRVFDRFYRSAAQSVEGSGIGLAIAKTGVKMHNGSITLNNRLDGKTGAVCKIILPLEPKKLPDRS
ncbi:MAG: HAMP domain-containing histidine kinase [Spirochaetia bacterium]|nr:HAMP domain-containing histidine kinase [Spirochaetia bacterium]